MPPTHNKRREILEGFLLKNPNDAFARYGLALECANLGDVPAAQEHFQALLVSHPDYVAGYFHYGQMLAKLGRTAEARETFLAGISVAQVSGDLHACEEMRAALASLE